MVSYKRVSKLLSTTNSIRFLKYLGPRFVERYGPECLLISARRCKMKHVKLLLDMGVDIESFDEITGDTSVFLAVYGGDPRLVRFLIERGCLVGATDFNGVTPLSKAIGMTREKHISSRCRGKNDIVGVINTLLSGGADVHQRDVHGRSTIVEAMCESDEIYRDHILNTIFIYGAPCDPVVPEFQSFPYLLNFIEERMHILGIPDQ